MPGRASAADFELTLSLPARGLRGVGRAALPDDALSDEALPDVRAVCTADVAAPG
jgi:hypothetical protein